MREELSDAEYAAMLKVRHRLEDGEFKFTTKEDEIQFEDYGIPYKAEDNIFDMSVIFVSNSCGTVGCIYGWMAFEMAKVSADPIKALSEATCARPRLHDLFYARGVPSIHRITPAQAVQAIDNYLMGIDPIWRHV
jgi:hypothetical protein